MQSSPRALFYLEDYVPGFETTGGRYTVSQEEILEFGNRFDPQPFHIDPEAAQASHFGGLVAPGSLTFAIRSALVNQLDFRPALVAGLGIDRLDLRNPVRPGDVLTLRLRVLASRRSRTRPDRGIVTLEYDVENQSKEIVLSMSARMMVEARGPAAD